MSYDIHLYRTEVRDTHEKSQDEDFFENETKLLAFGPEQKESLKIRLLTTAILLKTKKVIKWPLALKTMKV